MDFFTLLGRGHLPFVEAAYLVCLFWAALGKPERITNVGMFRWACLLFAVELIVPTLVNLDLSAGGALSGAAQGRQQSVGQGLWLSLAGPSLLMVSFLLAINSVMPPKKGSS